MRHAAKQDLYNQFSRIGKALASPARLLILDLLSQAEKSVEQTAEQTGLGMKNTSAQLRVLREARLVEARREPPFVFYRLAGDGVLRMVREIQALAHDRLAEVERITRLHYDASSALEPAEADELLRGLDAGDVTLLDVRPLDEFRAGHVPGAVSMPLEELEQRLSEIPRERPVIAYCRGPYCVFAVEAVERLRGLGYDARRMEMGPPDWRLAGRPIAVGAS